MDGKPVSDSDLAKESSYYKELTAKQTNFTNELDKHELLVKAAQLSYFTFRNFYTYFDENWFPESQVRQTIEKLYKQVFTDDSVKSAPRSKDEERKVWDPRNDYLDFL